jgi:rfaE bifunctional protein kinase chain/domain
MQNSEDRLGGAANVALNVQALGATVYLCSVVGEDANGHILQNLLKKRNLDASGLILSDARPTTVKTRVMAGNQQLLRVDQESSADLSAVEENSLLGIIRRRFAELDIDVVIFQDYNKGVLTPRLISETIGEAHQRQIPTAVDPKERHFWQYQGVTLFKPNLREMQEQTDFPMQADLQDLAKADALLRSRLHNQLTLITLSSKGLYLRGEGEGIIYPTFSRSIADVCGAGDTVISVAALALAAGLPVAQIAILANLAGGQVCERVGVVPVDLAQLELEFAVEGEALLTGKNGDAIY